MGHNKDFVNRVKKKKKVCVYIYIHIKVLSPKAANCIDKTPSFIFFWFWQKKS